METKQQIRDFCKKKRGSLPLPQADAHSKQIADHILNWKPYQQAERVLFYYPLGKEVSLLPVILDALAAGKKLAFPKVSGKNMDFYEVTDLSQLAEGCFHVMEPVTAEGSQPIQWEQALCFVPGVAFDRHGGRLGYGKGYYDRYFVEKRGTVLAGCAYGFQVVEQLPTEKYDQSMDVLISERGICACK